jgi:hypothetical protein
VYDSDTAGVLIDGSVRDGTPVAVDSTFMTCALIFGVGMSECKLWVDV